MASITKSKKAVRSLTLLADFQDGFAKDWFFAVGDFFMDQLDIKQTERVKNKIKTMEWTQGPFFCFAEGHILYDTPKGYSIWKEALRHINIVCSVIKGYPLQPCSRIPETKKG